MCAIGLQMVVGRPVTHNKGTFLATHLGRVFTEFFVRVSDWRTGCTISSSDLFVWVHCAYGSGLMPSAGKAVLEFIRKNLLRL